MDEPVGRAEDSRSVRGGRLPLLLGALGGWGGDSPVGSFTGVDGPVGRAEDSRSVG